MRALWIAILLAACASAPVTPATAQQRAPEGAAPVTVSTAATSATAGERIPEPNRPLTSGERELLRPIFRDGIDYDGVRVIHAAFPFQPNGVYMTPRGHIYAPGGLFRDDFSQPGAGGAVFVHEMTHVWQFANGLDLVAEGVAAFAKYRGRYEMAYPYVLERGRDLADYGMEQQASIVEDYYVITVDHGAPGQLENRGLSGMERAALYGSVLGKFLGDARYARALTAAGVVERHASAAEPPEGGSSKDHGDGRMCAWRFQRPSK